MARKAVKPSDAISGRVHFCGKLLEVFQAENKGMGDREFWVQKVVLYRPQPTNPDTGEAWGKEEHIEVQITGDRIKKFEISRYQNKAVDLECQVKSRKWEKDGKVSYFSNFDAIRLFVQNEQRQWVQIDESQGNIPPAADASGFSGPAVVPAGPAQTSSAQSAIPGTGGNGVDMAEASDDLPF